MSSGMSSGGVVGRRAIARFPLVEGGSSGQRDRFAPVRRAWWAATRHPVATTFVVAVLVAGLNIWWIHGHRHLGAYNTDEAGYMAAGLRARGAFALDDLR